MTKKYIGFLVLLVVLLLCVTAVSATDTTDNMTTATADITQETSTADTTVTQQETDNIQQTNDNTEENLEIEETYSDISIDITNSNKKKIVKSHVGNKVKSSNQIITLNATTFDTYVTDGQFNDNVHDGDVIDIDGKLDGDRFTLKVNKAVNITSFKNNSYIECGQFNIVSSGSNSNISNLNFVNTFISVFNAQNVIIDHIYSDNGAIQGRGQFSLGQRSNNCTVKNSYFKSWWNGGTSCVVLSGCTNCLIENNTIEGIGRVGNIFSLNSGSKDAVPTTITTPTGYRCYHVNITIRNNYIHAIGCESDICYGLYIEGMNILVENNTVIHGGQAVDNYYGRSYNVTFINNYVPYGNFANRAESNQLLINNTLNEVYSRNDSVIINNTINKLYTANNNTVENNNIKNIQIADNNTILNNRIGIATIDGDNVLFEGNIVNPIEYMDSIDYNYSVKIDSGNNITITNNELSNNLTYGDEAIDGTADVIENNFGKKFIIITGNSLTAEDGAYYIIKSTTMKSLSIRGKGRPHITLYNLNQNDLPNLASISTQNVDCDIVNSYIPNVRIGVVQKTLLNVYNTTCGYVASDDLNLQAVVGDLVNVTSLNNNSYLNYIVNEDGYLSYLNYGFDDELNKIEKNYTKPVLVTDFNIRDVIIDKSLNLTSTTDSYIRYRISGSKFFSEWLTGNGTIHNTVTFLDGSQGCNITNIIFNEKVYVNTSNINFNNCTFNKGIIFNNASENILESCSITTNAADTLINVKLTNDVNEAITNASITVTLPDGKTLTGVTDENGIINVPLDLSVGANDFVISYPGNGTYNKINITLPLSVDLNNMPINSETLSNTEGNVTITVSHDSISFTDDVPVVFVNSSNNQIINNNVLGYNGVTISLDSDSTANNIKANTLNATTKYNIDSVTGRDNNVFEDNGILYDVNINIDFVTPFYAGELNPLNITVTNTLNNESVENGYVEVWIDDLPYETLTLNNGQVSSYFTYNNATGSKVGHYKTLKVWYNPTEKYQTKKNTKNFQTLESTGNIQIDEITGTKVGDEIRIIARINSTDVISEGNISFQFADKSVSVAVQDNIANLTSVITPAMMDDPTLRLVFETDKAKYNIKSITTTLTIEQGIANIVVDEINTKINDEVNLTAHVTDKTGANINDGEIVFTTDAGETLGTVALVDGVASTTYTFTSEYNGKIIATINSPYREENSSENNLNVRKINTNIQINATRTDINTGETIVLSGNINDEDDNTLTYKDITLNINEVTYELVSNDKGTFTLPYSPTTGSTLNITATYNGDDIYNATTSNTIEITVTDKIAEQLENLTQQNEQLKEQLENLTQQNDELKDQLDNITQQNDELKDQLDNITQQNDEFKDQLDNVTQQLDNVTQQNDELKDQLENITQQNDELKDQLDNITQQNKELQEQLAALINALNAPENTVITLDPISVVKYNENVTISGLLTTGKGVSLSGMTVTVTIGNESVDLKTVNGVFEYSTIMTDVGEQSVSASYNGSNDYTASDATTTFNVNKLDTTLVLDDMGAVKRGDLFTLSGTLLDENGDAITDSVVKLLINNGRAHVTTDSEGKFTYSKQLTWLGINNITVSYLGNDIYEESSATGSVEVVALNTVITLDPVDQVSKGSQVTFSGKLTDEKGNAIANAQIRIIINGSAKTLKTDAQGVFTHTYTMSKLGENNITVTYAGGTYYQAGKLSTIVEVTKANAVITLDNSSNDVVQGSNATFSGKLTDENGIAIANAQVKIIINGSAKTLKTDADGLFNHIFKMTKEGTNNVTVTFAGNNYYQEANITSTIEVIKT